MDIGTYVIIGGSVLSMGLVAYQGHRLQKREDALVSRANENRQVLEETELITEALALDMNHQEREIYFGRVKQRLDESNCLLQQIQKYRQEISERNKCIEPPAMKSFTSFETALQGLDRRLSVNN